MRPGCANLANSLILGPSGGKRNTFFPPPSTEMLLAPFRFVITTIHLRNAVLNLYSVQTAKIAFLNLVCYTDILHLAVSVLFPYGG